MRDEPAQSGYYGTPPGDDIFGPQPTETVRMSTTLSPRANPYGTGFFGRAPGGERGPMYGPCLMEPPPGMTQQPQQQQVPLQQQQVPQQFPQLLNNFLRRHRCLWNKSCSTGSLALLCTLSQFQASIFLTHGESVPACGRTH